MQEMTPLQKYLLQRKLVGGGVGPETGMEPPMLQSTGAPQPIGPGADPLKGTIGTESDMEKKKMMKMRPYLGV